MLLNKETKPKEKIAQSAREGLLNTTTAPLQRSKTPSKGVEDMTLNNLMVSLQ